MALEHGTTARLVYENWHGTSGVDTDADRPWHRLIKAYLDPKCDLQGKRILEIGCGGGEFCCWLSKQPHRPAQIVAADFAATAVKKGRASAWEQRLFGILWEVSDIQMQNKRCSHAEARPFFTDRKSTRLNSSHVAISYAVFCLKKKKRV